MKFSFLFHEPVTALAELDRRMGVLKALGYHGIELSAFHPMPYSITGVQALALKHNLPVVSMLTGWSYGEGCCLSSPDPAARSRAAARLCNYVDQAAELGCLLVVGLLQGLRKDEPDGSLANDRIAEGLGIVARKAAEKGVRLVIEPVNHLQVGFNNRACEARAMARRVHSAALGYMLDTFHLNIEERSVESALDEFAAEAWHFHLCETTGLRLGSGHLDLPGVLRRLEEQGYSGVVSVKIYRDPDWEGAARHSAEMLRSLGAL